jgi:hypothetical protein
MRDDCRARGDDDDKKEEAEVSAGVTKLKE